MNRKLLRWVAPWVVLVAARTAAAGSIQFTTGNVEQDFMPNVSQASVYPGTNSQGGGITLVNATSTTPGMIISNNYTGANPITWLDNQGTNPALTVKDVRVSYDPTTDNLYVGVNFFGIAGDANGVINPGSLLGRESITMALAFGKNPSNSNAIIVGVPNQTANAGPGLDGFTVTSFKGDTNAGIEDNYGTSLNSHNGGLAFEPSSAHPGFEFVLTHASTLPGFSPTSLITMEVYAGASTDSTTAYGSKEEDGTGYLYAPLGSVEFQVPEPGSMLAWSLVAAVGAWRGLSARRRLGSKTPA